MRIDIPFNGDINIVNKINNTIHKDFDFLLYGNLPMIKTGRPNADINKKQLLSFLEKYGNYYKGLLNIPANLEIKNIDIKPYLDLGINYYTINSIELAKKIKEKHPEVKITLGVYAFIDDFLLPDRDYEYFDDIMIPHYFANRNITKLKQYLEKFKDKCSLFLNQICKFGCTEYVEHSNYLQKNNKGQNFYFLGCSLFLIENPLIGVWYRPEDIPKLIEIGFKKFKIINRKDTTEDIIYKVYHYTHFKETDDLFRLIRPRIKQNELKMEQIWQKIHKFNTETKISSKNLPNDWFEKTMHCTLKKCNEDCYYCNDIWNKLSSEN